MCGITGFYLRENKYQRSILNENLILMSKELSHRGPNANGTWIDDTNKLGFGHSRLSIRDLSQNGNQPMISSCKRYVIVYNGEIYDTKNLENELINANINLKSSSDTEVLLEYIANFGLKKTLEKINGMFAFALYDIKKQILYLVRDRLGIKPLFYYINNTSFSFGSEIKSLNKFFDFKKSINLNSLNSFLKFGFNKNSTSIYNNVDQVKPGEVIEVDRNLEIKKNLYWSYKDFFKQKKSMNSLNQSLEELENLITNSIKIRLISDVEVGSFLSGGIDSSLVSCIMSEVSEKKIKTFSVGFLEKKYDESQDARNISKHIGSEHHEIIIEKNELLSFFDRIPEIYDEPFADSSQIPTAIISNYAKKNAGVILSGDGGDELFGGYTRYIEAKKNITKKIDVKTSIKKILGNIILKTNDKNILILEKIFNKINLKERSRNFLDLHNLNQKFYFDFLCQWQDLTNILHPQFIKENLKKNNDLNFISDHYENFMAHDIGGYLPNDILTKVDRASMNSSLEVRVPLLDYRIVEFAIKLPTKYKIFDNNQKIILKELLKKKLPKKLIKNKKVGFGIPLDEWLRTFLKSRGDYLFSDECLKINPYLNKKFVQKIWHDHKNDKFNHGLKIWNILMFQQWMNKNA